MPTLLHVHLKEVAHVVQRRRGVPEKPLLLHRRRLGIALNDHQAPEHGTVRTRDFLPHRLTLVLSEPDGAARLLGREQHAQRYCGIFTNPNCAQPSGSTLIAVRRYTSQS